MIYYSGKSIVFENKRVILDYLIKKVIEFESIVVVLFYDKEIIPNNIVAFDTKGNQAWKINDILQIKNPTGNVDIMKMSKCMLGVYSDLSIEYRIDVNKRELINKTYLR